VCLVRISAGKPSIVVILKLSRKIPGQDLKVSTTATFHVLSNLLITVSQ
jgi:hypothetical protein